MTALPWLPVIFPADCDEGGDCPICDIDFTACACPGPNQEDEFEYRERGGVLEARLYTPRLGHDEWADLGTLLARSPLPRDRDDE